jgi:hypothetical protein
VPIFATAGGSLAGQQGRYWSGEGLLANASGAAFDSTAVKAVQPSPQTQDTTTAPGLLAQYPETLAYDADGNLVADGLWDYTWDAENRPELTFGHDWQSPQSAHGSEEAVLQHRGEHPLACLQRLEPDRGVCREQTSRAWHRHRIAGSPSARGWA